MRGLVAGLGVMLVDEGGADGEAGGDSACNSIELQLVGALRRGRCSGVAAATGRDRAHGAECLTVLASTATLVRGEAGCGGSHSRCGDYPHSDLVLLQLPQRERSREPGVARAAGRAS